MLPVFRKGLAPGLRGRTYASLVGRSEIRTYSGSRVMPIILYGLALQLAVSAVKQRRDVSGGFEPLKPLRHVAVPPTVAEESFSIRRNIWKRRRRVLQ